MIQELLVGLSFLFAIGFISRGLWNNKNKKHNGCSTCGSESTSKLAKSK